MAANNYHIGEALEAAVLAKRDVELEVRRAIDIASSLSPDWHRYDGADNALVREIMNDHDDPLIVALLRHPNDRFLRDPLQDKVYKLMRRDEEKALWEQYKNEEYWDYDGLGVIHPADRKSMAERALIVSEMRIKNAAERAEAQRNGPGAAPAG